MEGHTSHSKLNFIWHFWCHEWCQFLKIYLWLVDYQHEIISVSGVNQYFEISKRSHATLTSLSPNKTKGAWKILKTLRKDETNLTLEFPHVPYNILDILSICIHVFPNLVEIYPTFAIRMGCDFDYRSVDFKFSVCELWKIELKTYLIRVSKN